MTDDFMKRNAFGALTRLLAALLVVSAGCQQQRPAPGAEPAREPTPVKPADRPAKPDRAPAQPAVAQPAPAQPARSPQPTPAPAPVVSTPPAKPEPVAQAPAEPEESAESEEGDKLPPYVRILRLSGATARPTVDVEARTPATLELHTNGVERLWVGRRELPVGRNSSVALRIDEQVFEWSRSHTELELEFSPNTGWKIVRRYPDP
jgi:hypothetical protein